MPNDTSAAPEKVATELTKRPRPKKLNWAPYLKDSAAYLHEAVALSLNVSPIQMAKPKSDTNDPISRKYIMRMRAARLEMGPGAAITVFEEGKRDDGSDWIIDLKSFVIFALSRDWGAKSEEFKQLGAEKPSSNTSELKTECSTSIAPKDETKFVKAPVRFVSALILLLVEIAKRATKNGEPFNVEELPGQREDLKELSDQFGLFPSCTQSTFNTYTKGLCKFLPGQPKSNFYRNLFPEKFKIP
jgi:hypothetical protein